MNYLKSKKQNYLNQSICITCGGACCRRLPGAAFPEDFIRPIKNSVREALRSGKWVIDMRGGNFFIRPSTKWNRKILSLSLDVDGIGCVFLSKTGCALPADVRPKTCRSLEPKEKECILHDGASEWESAEAWSKYKKFFIEIIKNEKNNKEFLYVCED